MAEVIVPKGTVPGTLEWMQTNASLAKSWANRANGDVRELVKYLRRIKQHNWRPLVGGADDWPRLCREVLDSHPTFLAQMEAGVAALEDKGHEGPITVEQAQEASKAQQLARNEEVKPMPTLAEAMTGNQNARKEKEEDEKSLETVQGEKEEQEKEEENSGADGTAVSGPKRGSNHAEYLIKRIKRDALDPSAPNHARAASALSRLQAGEITSARRAAIETGIVKVPTLVQQAAKLLKKLTTEELVEALLTLPVDVRQRLAEALTGAQTQP